MNLSKRLKLLASLVPDGARVCDVGTDHAKLPIFLVSTGKISKIIATDIRKKPLENAINNITASGVLNIETRLCDGLSAVSYSEVDTIIIAGIGGEVISGIISRTDWLKQKPSPLLIIQPTTSPELLRQFLYKNGFNIETDTALFDNGKLYSVMTVRFGGKNEFKDDSFYYIGKVNPCTKDGYLYIEKQYKRLKSAADALKGNENENEKFLYYNKLSNSLAELLKINGD